MKPFSLTLPGGRVIEYHRPVVMGIINVTPDSFYKESRATSEACLRKRVEEMISEGADMLDIGGYSSRPGAEEVSCEEECKRLERGLKIIRSIDSDIPVSIDTFRASVARICVRELGADIINDISGGTLDDEMFSTVAELKVPYILMHMRGTPADMQQHTDYRSLLSEVISHLAERLHRLALLGVNDVIIDPGFGFSKTLNQNYSLLANLRLFESLDRPLLVGVSRKSMITNLLNVSPSEALNGTTVVNTIAIGKGASVLRVHDVEAARQAVEIFVKTQKSFLKPNPC